MTRIRLMAAAGGVTLMAATVPLMAAVPAQAASLEVGVAASPNGYVMAGQPTQIAVNQAAEIYMKAAGKWMLLGSATKSAALPMTFKESGIYTLKVKSGKTSKTIKVGAYGRFHEGRPTPTNYAGSILTADTNIYAGPWTAAASSNCVRVDVGATNESGAPSSVAVLSTGAPAATLEIPAGGSNVLLNLPVSGDAVIEATYDRRGFGYLDSGIGIVWTCLSQP